MAVLERREGGGHYQLRVRFPDTPTGWQPLVVSARRRPPQYLAFRVLPGNRVQVAYNSLFKAKLFAVRSHRHHEVDVLMDTIPDSPTEGTVQVTLDGKATLLMNCRTS